MGRQATIHSKTARVIALLDAVAAWRLLRVPAADGTASEFRSVAAILFERG